MKLKAIQRVFSRIPYYRSRFNRILTHDEIPGQLEAWLYYRLYQFREFRSFWMRPRTDEDRAQSSVYLDLVKEIQDRYLFQLISFFIYGGCSVRFVTDGSKDCLAPLEYTRLVYTFENFRIISEPPSDCSDAILCTDSEQSAYLHRQWKRLLVLNPDISVNHKDHKGALMMPYPMHPIIYKRKQHEGLGRFRENERRVAILFSGNYGEGYSHSILPNQFGKMSRPEIMALLLAWGLPQIQIVNRREEIESFLSGGGYKNLFMLVNTQNIYIDQKYWLEALSKSHFFLAAPGDIRPMCHNIIEAMAVGTIPITAYPEWFNPPLSHLKNCLVYTDKTDLFQKIEMAMEMDGDDVNTIRRDVIHYYDHYLSPESFVNSVQSASEDNLELFIQTGNSRYLAQVNENSVICKAQ